MTKAKCLDVIKTTSSIPMARLTLIEPHYQHIQNLPIGQVGTIVEVYPAEKPHYLVEFADLQGREYAMAVLQADEFRTVDLRECTEQAEQKTNFSADMETYQMISRKHRGSLKKLAE